MKPPSAGSAAVKGGSARPLRADRVPIAESGVRRHCPPWARITDPVTRQQPTTVTSVKAPPWQVEPRRQPGTARPRPLPDREPTARHSRHRPSRPRRCHHPLALLCAFRGPVSHPGHLRRLTPRRRLRIHPLPPHTTRPSGAASGYRNWNSCASLSKASPSTPNATSHSTPPKSAAYRGSPVDSPDHSIHNEPLWGSQVLPPHAVFSVRPHVDHAGPQDPTVSQLDPYLIAR